MSESSKNYTITKLSHKFYINIKEKEKNITIIDDIYKIYKNELYKTNEEIYIQDETKHSFIGINLKNKLVICKKKDLKYCMNILNNGEINNVDFVSLPDNTIYQKTANVELPSYIKKISVSCYNDNQYEFLNDICNKNTTIRFYDCWDMLSDKKFTQFLKKNTTIYSLDIQSSYLQTVCDFIKNNPNNSLQYVYASNLDTSFRDLKRSLKNKRIIIKQQILTIMLIIKHGHKYIKYAPKTIMKIILEYMYDVEYIKMHETV